MKKTKAARESEKQFCDSVAAHLLKSGAKQTRSAYVNLMGDYSPGEYDIDTRVGMLHVHPTGSTVFARFAEPERAVRLVGVSANGKWNHHFDGANAATATGLNRQLDALLTGPKLYAKEPDRAPSPPPSAVAIVRRLLPGVGPPEQDQKGLTFFQTGKTEFQIGRNPVVAEVRRYGISCNFQSEIPFVGLAIVDARGDHYKMPSPDIIQRNGIAGISEKEYSDLFTDLTRKAKRVERALGTPVSSEAKPRRPRQIFVKKLRDAGPVLSHGGCPPRCGRFHSTAEHERERKRK